jgi:O-antigen/teichoic acid export membrane protein
MLQTSISRLFRRLKSDAHMREILGKGSASFVARALGTALNFLFQIILARLLGAHGVGIYYLALSTTTSAALIARMGMDHNLTRTVAAQAESENWAAIRQVASHALRAGLIAAVLAVAIVFFSAGWVSEHVFAKPDLTAPLSVMAFAIMPVAMIILYARALQGLRLVAEATLVETAITPFTACALVFVLVSRFEIVGGTIAYCVGAMIALSVAALTWQRRSGQWPSAESNSEVGSTVKFVLQSSPYFGVMLCQQLALVAPLFILGALRSGADVGLFYSANRTAALIGLILVAANSIVAPKIAALYQSRDLKTLDRVVRRSAMLVSMVALPALLVFLLAPSFVMSVFGSEFAASADLLRVLALGQLVNIVTGSVGFVLLMTENLRSVFITSILLLITVVGLSLFLVPQLGAMGAALATTGSLLVASIIRVILAWRDLRIVALPIPGRLIPDRFRSQ